MQVDWPSAGREPGYVVHFRYTVGTGTYEHTTGSLPWYEPGSAVRGCYDPKNPRDVDLRPSLYRCGEVHRPG